MSLIREIFQGHFTPRTLRIYLAVEVLLFWGVIFVCWRLFPAENAFSIHTHTFSYLGSFELDRNPRGWWLFGAAMTAWGLATVPLVRYSTRRVAPVAPRGARVVRGLLLAGCAGVMIVGIFPDARGEVVAGVRWTDLHYFGALFVVLGFLIGITWLAVLVRRAARFPEFDPATRRAFQRARWPHAFFVAVSAVALFYLIRWEFVYPKLKAAAEAEGRDFGSSWREAMHTIYSFPLWDNVFVVTLFVYFVWATLALPDTISQVGSGTRGARTGHT